VEAYLSRPNKTVIAAVRDTSSPTSKSLTALPTVSGSKVILVKIETLSETDAKDALQTL